MLGAGGMGQVYLARDTRLGREVAIKVLPEHLSANPEVRARFEREARAISALHHPHICTLYDVGRHEGLEYLVMERLDGETLAARLARGAMPIPELVKVARDIAEALDAAHRQGLVHRDLKPGNVMLTAFGAKLLDFGLARAVGLNPSVSPLTESPTVSQPLTTEGSIVGTLHYMSPEQLDGREADARVDIWAFGVMLYEMATGQRPFQGHSHASLIGAIMEREPEPLAKVVPVAPVSLDRLIRRCLAKDPDQRWQTARDLIHELDWVKEDSSAVRATPERAITISRAPRRRGVWLAGAVAVLAVVTAFVVLAKPLHRGPPRLNPAMTLRTIPLPFPQINYPGMSQDGSWIALPAANARGRWALYFMNIHGGEAREITSEGGRGISYADISPDGSQITYSVSREIVGQSIRVVPALGGQSVEISDKGSGPHWRPDGDRVGYMLQGLDTGQKKLELWSVKPDGSDRHLEYADTSCSGGGRICFAWSPNGKSIAWLRGFAGDSYQEIVVRDLASGKERQLTHDGKNIDEVWWTHQNEIVFSSNRSGNTNLWIVSASGGPPVQVTKGLGPDIGMRVSADGKTLLYLQSMPVRHLWIGNLADGSAHQVTHDDLVLGSGSLSPDGHKIVVPIMDPDPLHPSGKVVIMDRDGGNRRQIASGPNLIWNADWSRDGEWIAYAARSTVHPDSSSIYVVRADAPGVPKRIAYGVGAYWMPDGTVDVTGQMSNRFVSSPEGTVLWQSPDSTTEYPAPGGDRVVVDIHHDHRGIWLRPGQRNTSALVFVDSLSTIFVGGARDGSWAMTLGEDGTLTRLDIPSLRRQKLPFTFQGLTMDSHIGAAWDQREVLYDESGVSSKIVLIENLK